MAKFRARQAPSICWTVLTLTYLYRRGKETRRDGKLWKFDVRVSVSVTHRKDMEPSKKKIGKRKIIWEKTIWYEIKKKVRRKLLNKLVAACLRKLRVHMSVLSTSFLIRRVLNVWMILIFLCVFICQKKSVFVFYWISHCYFFLVLFLVYCRVVFVFSLVRMLYMVRTVISPSTDSQRI